VADPEEIDHPPLGDTPWYHSFVWETLDSRRLDERGHPLGRLPKYCESLRMQALFRAIEAGHYPSDAAHQAGIDRGTLTLWRDLVPEIAAAVKDAEVVAKRRLLATVSAAGPVSWQASAWLLERRWPGEFGRRDRTTHHVEGMLVGAIQLKPSEMSGAAILLAAQLEEEMSAAEQRALPSRQPDSTQRAPSNE
jgi:hypothetical protein